MTVLIVDDDPDYRLLLKTLLKDEGWEVFSAEDGEDALRVMLRVEMNLVISDIYMPVMDGFKLYQRVRAIPRYKKLPFIFVSAFDDDYTMDAVQDPRYETFLPKTSPIENFVDWINYLALPEDKRPRHCPTAEANHGLPKPQYLFLP